MVRSPPCHPDTGGPRTSSTAARSSPLATACIRWRSTRPPSLSASAPGRRSWLLDPVDPDRAGLEFGRARLWVPGVDRRSEEHTSELQSRPHLVCRLLLEKKNGSLRTE